MGKQPHDTVNERALEFSIKSCVVQKETEAILKRARAFAEFLQEAKSSASQDKGCPLDKGRYAPE
jgi:hypothetical protein